VLTYKFELGKADLNLADGELFFFGFHPSSVYICFMTKYIIAVLLLIAALAGLLLYVGDDATLTLTSSAESGALMMAPVVLSWQAVIVILAVSLLSIIGIWSFVTWLWSLPGRIKSGVGLRRRNQALEAMEEALIAGSDGDVTKARRKAERARKLISSEDGSKFISEW